jgi:hypothetical protein
MGSADRRMFGEGCSALGKRSFMLSFSAGHELCRSALGAKDDSSLLAVLLRTFDFELADPAYELKLGKLQYLVTCVSNT